MDVPSPRPLRRIVKYAVLTVCGFVAIHVWGVEPFEIPTGSMAPTLLGHHRTCDCPSCGFRVVREQSESERDEVRCPNCGTGGLALSEAQGDRVLVYKSAFVFRRPRRFEIVVFKRNGKIYVKRILGLPGETIEIRDGDIYVDGELLRKTLDEARDMRVLIGEAYAGPAQIQKCEPLSSEYTYNGRSSPAETVHDFFVDCEIEVEAGNGTLRLGLTDGQDEVFAELPLGKAGQLVTWTRPHAGFADLPPMLDAQGFALNGLKAGRTHRVELAFVDRRLSVAVNGEPVGVSVDLPTATRRQGVERPMYFEVKGAEVRLKSARLCRDLHYTQSGRNAVANNTVLLSKDQYFVLGDNSANSEDSRFWADHGAVDVRDMVGKALLVYFPSRPVDVSFFGSRWQLPLPDTTRIRWLP